MKHTFYSCDNCGRRLPAEYKPYSVADKDYCVECKRETEANKKWLYPEMSELQERQIEARRWK